MHARLMAASPALGCRIDSKRERAWIGRTALACAALFGAAVACTTNLDPSVVVGAGGESGELPGCSRFDLPRSDYLICPGPLDFEAAAADCIRRGATLAAVGAEEENDFLAATAAVIVNDDTWLGATRDDSYVWRWADGAVFWRGGPDGATEAGAFANWRAGEPNDSSTVTNEPERCLALKYDQSDWNDRACTLRLPYACEQVSTP
jgi:hypothetical protein